MEDDSNAPPPPPPPFWLQSSNSQANSGRRRRRLTRASSFLLDSGAFLIASLVIVLCFILIVIPKFVQFTSQLIRPQSVTKSWDLLNLVLVLFAIVCAFLSKTTGDENRSSFEDRSGSSTRRMRSIPASPPRWGDGYVDHRPNPYSLTRMRSSSSYPDLRLQESSFDPGDGRWRFYDDTHVPDHRFASSDQLHRRREARPELQREDSGARNIGFNRSEIREDAFSQPPIPSPPPPRVSPPRSPTPPPPANTTTPKAVKRRPRRTQNVHNHKPDVAIDEQQKNDDSDITNYRPIQLPPLSPPSFYRESEQKSGKNEKKRSSASKEIWSALRRRKKKQRQKSVESFEAIIASQRASTSSLPPPSPPPPPPPPSFLQNLISSKKGKSKKLPSAPPPSISSSEPKPEIENQNNLTVKPRDPPMEFERLSSLNDEEFNNRTGSESPFHPIPPPPPPPPPFRMHGDFDSAGSNSSTPRAASPEIDESEADAAPAAMETKLVKDSTTLIFCSSPDVDRKATKFIERFRADLKMQKINSFREKTARKRSNLGRTSGPGPK